MKALHFSLFMLLVPGSLQASDPDFTMFRWNESYEYLAAKRVKSNYERLKYVPLIEGDPDKFLSLGGVLRQRVNHFENDLFDLQGAGDGHLFLSRFLLHGDLHMTSNVRAFVEVGVHSADGNDIRPGPFDSDEPDITQAFIDIDFDSYRLRLGRQEMSLGSTRLLGVRDGPNVRRAFDGVRIDTALQNAHLQIFASNEVELEGGGFDNSSNDDESFWGVYSTWDFSHTDADIYYVGISRADAAYNQGREDELRHSLGMRIFGEKDKWDWNYELIYQFGEFGVADIRAWTAAGIFGFTFQDRMWSPRIALSTNVASGDNNSGDDELTTFNPLFPNLMYFEEAAILSPQNFYNFEPEITVHPTEKLSISIDWNLFWRLEESDAVYVRGLNVLSNSSSTTGNFVAHIPSLSIDYKASRHFTFDLSYSHFFAEEVIESSYGRDVNFIKAQISWTF